MNIYNGDDYSSRRIKQLELLNLINLEISELIVKSREGVSDKQICNNENIMDKKDRLGYSRLKSFLFEMSRTSSYDTEIHELSRSLELKVIINYNATQEVIKKHPEWFSARKSID